MAATVKSAPTKKSTVKKAIAKKTTAKSTTSKQSAARKRTSTKDVSDPIALLKADHRKVEQLFADYEGTRSDAKKVSLVQQLCQELIVHADIEEKLFYPPLQGSSKKTDELLDEAQVEHDSLKVLILDLLKQHPDDEYRDAKVTVLKEYVEHHVKEEEKPKEGIFARARAAGIATSGLASQMQQHKTSLMSHPNSMPMPRPKSFQLGQLLQPAGLGLHMEEVPPITRKVNGKQVTASPRSAR